ncbi:MAG: hypothetical protein M3O50_07975 [Myxococcota bacterium]|nr:hypothetical protein [Myxococcota bacterium]
MAHSRWIALVVCAYGIACSGAGDGGGAEGTSSSVSLTVKENRDRDREEEGRRKNARREGCTENGTSTGPGPGGGGADAGKACGWVADSNGLSGASVVDALYDTRAPGVVYAVGGSVVFQSLDSGASWHVQGRVAGSISQLALSGTSPGALLGASTTGVLASADGGKTWSSLSLQGLSLSSISVAAAHPLRVYVGTQRSGALRSDDGGRTWAAMGFGYPYGDTLGLSVDPGNADVVVASVAQIDANGAPTGGEIVRSTDGGATWTVTLPGAGLGWGVTRCAGDASVLYAATGHGVSRSADGGVTWTTKAVGPYGATNIAISPGGCDDLYALVYADGPKHSIDGGKSFGPALNQGLDIVPVGSSGTLLVDPLRPGHVLFGSHGGIWTSSNGGSAWIVAQGLLGLMVSSLDVSPLDPSRLWLSSWGSGVWERAASGQPWQRIPATRLPIDYTFVVASDPYVAKRVLVGGWNTLYQANDGATFAPSTLTDNSFAFAFDPHDAKVLYTATQVGGIFKSLDGGTTWTPSNGALAPWPTPAGNFIDVRAIAIEPTTPQTLFIGTNGHGVYKSTDGGSSWVNVLAPAKAIGCLVLVPAVAGSPQALYACVAGAGIQRSADSGSTWSDASQGLPSLGATALVRDATTGDLYASSAGAVYVRQHGAAAWTPFDAGCLQGAGALAITTDAGTRRVVVASGGAVWSHALQ